jgi:ATP-dependent DNA helicase RecQ
MMLKVLDVDGAVRRVSGGWEATGRPWAYDSERYAQLAEARRHEQQAMLDYVTTTGCRMEFLRRQLDDPDAAPCGGCDNCTGRHWPDTVPEHARTSARERLLRPGVTVEPRKMWPTAMAALGVDVRGRIPDGLTAAPGRALGQLTGVGWGGRLRNLLDAASPDAPVPDDVFQAVVRVLAAWGWEHRPVGIVTIASSSRPLLIESLGSRLASVGRLPMLGQVSYTGSPGANGAETGAHNSAQRLRVLWDRFCLPPALATALADLGGPVLLVDDRIETGWTMTVVAKLLREAGAHSVLPLALSTLI